MLSRVAIGPTDRHIVLLCRKSEVRSPKSEVQSTHFLLAKLSEKKLAFAPEADRRTLIRRVYFDLIGLPPTPEEVEAFVADQSPDAYERLVDRLLASPRFGERMAEWWLDVVRYAETDGFKSDAFRPNAWRYRDYVIESFNADKPFDRFVKEQLAGDELFPDDPDALVATGYLAPLPGRVQRGQSRTAAAGDPERHHRHHRRRVPRHHARLLPLPRPQD